MILVTGATGFVGQALIKNLLTQNHSIQAAVRRLSASLPNSVKQTVVGDLVNFIDWSDALQSVDTIVHCAARVHVMNDSSSEPLAVFRQVNTEATVALARQAAEAGVRRFVFLSSVKVNGEETDGLYLSHHSNSLSEEEGIKDVFVENDGFIPSDPYGLSKYEAEQGLLALAKESGMEVVIIRPPLVYGPAVRANFALMMCWVGKGIPLPFGAVHNQRSLIALDNLVSFISHCIHCPKAANEVFLISDGEDVSTTELLRKVAKSQGKRSLLLPIPVALMCFSARLIGQRGLANRLFGSLRVDSSKARDLLGWEPVITMDEQLKKMSDSVR